MAMSDSRAGVADAQPPLFTWGLGMRGDLLDPSDWPVNELPFSWYGNV